MSRARRCATLGSAVPELPEVETVRRGIESRAVGRPIVSVEASGRRTVRRFGRESLIDGLTGATIVAAHRHGKYLLCPLDTGFAVMIHLRMSGRVLIASTTSPRPPHTHVSLEFAPSVDGSVDELRFVDPRTFGEVVVFDPARADEQIPELGRLGPDALDPALDPSLLRAQLGDRRTTIKAALLDQRVVAGIGNIYSDEILHRARIGPRRVAGRLSPDSIGRLHASMREVLARAVTRGGSTLDDTQYVNVDGAVGAFQDEHRVYGRAGAMCRSCGMARISRAVVAGRTTCWCRRCQR